MKRVQRQTVTPMYEPQTQIRQQEPNDARWLLLGAPRTGVWVNGRPAPWNLLRDAPTEVQNAAASTES